MLPIYPPGSSIDAFRLLPIKSSHAPGTVENVPLWQGTPSARTLSRKLLWETVKGVRSPMSSPSKGEYALRLRITLLTYSRHGRA